MAVKLRCSVVHKIGLPAAVSQPASISFPQWGHFIRQSPPKEKNALPLVQETKRFIKHSAVPLSVAVPLRDTAAHCPPSRAGAVTGTKRPRLLARSPSEHEMFRKCRRAMGTPARPMEDSTRVPRYQIATRFRFERILRSRRLSAGGSQGIFAAAPGRLPPSGGSLCRGIAGYSS